jgi:hypothetical protein
MKNETDMLSDPAADTRVLDLSIEIERWREANAILHECARLRAIAEAKMGRPKDRRQLTLFVEQLGLFGSGAWEDRRGHRGAT